MREFTVAEIRNQLNTAMLAHLKEINMTPFTVFEISGRAMLYMAMLNTHYGWDNDGFKLLLDMAKTVSIPGTTFDTKDGAKAN